MKKIKRTLHTYNHPAAAAIKQNISPSLLVIPEKQKIEPQKSTQRHVDRGLIMCTDICGPIHPYGITSDVTFYTFTGVGARYTFFIPMRTRAHIVEYIDTELKYAKRQTGATLTILNDENACEYIYATTRNVSEAAGTTLNTIVRSHPEQNGISDRVNINLMNAVRVALQTAQMEESH